MRLYVKEGDIEFTCVEDKALKSCNLSVNMYLLTFMTT